MSMYCHKCGTTIMEDDESLCGKCKPRRFTFHMPTWFQLFRIRQSMKKIARLAGR